MTTDDGAAMAERFLTAWKRLETHLAKIPGENTYDMSERVRRAERAHLISASTADFLQACRRARNAYAHIAFEGYVGPVTLPPPQVVKRLERVVASIVSPKRVTSIAKPAIVCLESTPIRDALFMMAEYDFSQLPYFHESKGWVLFTRMQVGRLLDQATDADGQCLIDLEVPVADILTITHPLATTTLPRQTSVAMALDALELALITPDNSPGGYPAILICEQYETRRPHILTADDLPALYDQLGR